MHPDWKCINQPTNGIKQFWMILSGRKVGANDQVFLVGEFIQKNIKCSHQGGKQVDFITKAEFFQVAKASHRLYNLTSNIQEQEDNQMFPILTLPKDGREQKTLGTNNALLFPPSASKGPEYIAPSVDPINTLIQNLSD